LGAGVLEHLAAAQLALPDMYRMLYLLFNQISLDENNFILGPQKVQHHGKKASTTRAQANKQTGSLTKGRKDIGTDGQGKLAGKLADRRQRKTQPTQPT